MFGITRNQRSSPGHSAPHLASQVAETVNNTPDEVEIEAQEDALDHTLGEMDNTTLSEQLIR